MRRIAVGGIVHETNTFSPNLTDIASFRQLAFDEGEKLIEHWYDSVSSLGGALQALNEHGYEVVPLIYATAMPSGTVTRAAYNLLLDRFEHHLKAALPVDGVLLVLHGAMVAEDQDDCEGEILTRVRALVGVACPLISVLDMHGSLTPTMIGSADALVAFNKHPHTDTFERGVEAAHIMARFLEEGLRFTRAFARPRLLLNALNTATARLPLIAMHEQAEIFRKDSRVVNVSIMGGFAYSDIPFAGVSVLVSITHEHQSLAQQMADTLADIAWQHRKVAEYAGMSVEVAVKQAVSAHRGPVILADVGDNVGGGSPGDGTVLLDALLKVGAQDAVVVLADPEAVEHAVLAGLGSTIDMQVGGKQDRRHGDPIRVHGTVVSLTDGRFSVEGRDHFANIYGREVHMGRCACLRCDGIDLLLTERKTPPGDLEQLRSQGIVPEAKNIIVVKSPVAFRSAYESIATDIFEVDTPGICAANLNRFTYRKLRRPIFPLDKF